MTTDARQGLNQRNLRIPRDWWRSYWKRPFAGLIAASMLALTVHSYGYDAKKLDEPAPDATLSEAATKAAKKRAQDIVGYSPEFQTLLQTRVRLLEEWQERSRRLEEYGFMIQHGVTVDENGQYRFNGGLGGIAQRFGNLAGAMVVIEQIHQAEIAVEKHALKTSQYLDEQTWRQLSVAERQGCKRHLPLFYRSASGQYWNELREAEGAVRMRSEDPQALINRAGLYTEQKLFFVSVDDYSRAIRFSPRDKALPSIALKKRAALYARRHRYSVATADYERALSLVDDAEARVAVAEIYLRSEQPDKALAHADAVLNHPPESAAALRIRGEAHGALGEYSKAMADLQASAKLAPRSADLHVALGVQYARQKEFDKALMEYETAIECDPENPRALYYRGFHRFQMQQDPTGAIVDFDKAAEFDLWEPDILQNRGAAYDTLGNRKKAFKDYRAAAVLRDLAGEQKDK